MKKFIQDYLIFSKKDRLAIALLLLIIGLPLLLSRFLLSKKSPEPLKQHTYLQKAIDTLAANSATAYAGKDDPSNPEEESNISLQYQRSSYEVYKPGALFTFDPNTASDEEWRRMGLTARTVKTINNYRSKGGKFYKPEDLERIWGLPEGFYERVKNYIAITSVAKKEYRNEYPKPAYEKREHKIAVVNINDGDTTAFEALPGIGARLAYRITSFRDKLGGFYSIEQVKETYGLPDSTFQKIKPYLNAGNASVRKINLNAATKEELKIHPYIRWQLANVIVEYRNQHGAYKNLAELKNIATIDEATFEKIIPYLSL